MVSVFAFCSGNNEFTLKVIKSFQDFSVLIRWVCRDVCWIVGVANNGSGTTRKCLYCRGAVGGRFKTSCAGSLAKYLVFL